MQVTVTSQVGKPYQHHLTARSHTVVSDVDTSMSGSDLGPTPHELALLSLGACGAITMEMYAKRKQLNLTQVTVTVTEDTVADPADGTKKIPRITLDFQLDGNLTDAEVAKLKSVGEKCPVLALFVGNKVVDTNVARKV